MTDVALDTHHYGLRTLREGWVYLFYEVGARGNRYWEVYKVTSDGRLWKQPLPLPQTPITDPACAQRAIAVPMDLIAIEQPEKCTGRVYIAFSEHTWHKEVFDRYAANETLRYARMQFIRPSEWIASSKDANGHAIVATQQAIDDIIEYMPGFDAKLMSPPDDKQPFSDEKGGYKDEFLKREVTRYTMHIRQASPASASQALLKVMKQIGMKGQDRGDGAPSHPPMMLALWDGIGNVHELNGFRGDPASWLEWYVTKERPLQVKALQAIDAAHAIVESQTDQDLKNREATAQQAHSMTSLDQPHAQSALNAQRAKALANAEPKRSVQINAYYDDMSWMAANNILSSYQRRLVQFAQSTSAASANSRAPYIGTYRDQIMSDARSYAKAQPGLHERSVTTMRNYNWSKYEARLKRQEIENFRKNYKSLQSAVFNLQELRSADVGKWLGAKLFLDTLEDYESMDLFDSATFEIVITEALAGIGSTPKGKAILDVLVTYDPLQPGSLIWRVFAMNMKDARQELKELLTIALAKKDMPLESDKGDAEQSPGVNAVISASGITGKLNSYYKNFAKLALEKEEKKISPLGGLLKRLEVDRFGMTVGDAIYAKLRIDKIGDFVGEKIIQNLILKRAGISDFNAIRLIRKQAELEKLSRQEKILRLSNALSEARTGALSNEMKSTQALYSVWNQMKSTNDGTKAIRSSRIAVVAGILELVNFYKLMAAAPDENTKIKLVQSGSSMLSSLITITMAPYYGTLKNSMRSQTWKLTGSGLSSFGTFISAWCDGEKASKAYDKQRPDIFLIYLGKTGVGVGTGIATLIDATSTSAPLLKELAKRAGMTVIIEATEAVSTRVMAYALLRTLLLRSAAMLIGWEATIILLALQVMADWLTPNELEGWCSRCAFGTGRETIFRIADHDVERYTDHLQQEKDFTNAMTELS